MSEARVVWRKSSRSGGNGGNCLEVAGLDHAIWTKSSRSNKEGGNCLEVATDARAVAMRDSKDPAGPVLMFSPDAWVAFTSAAREGLLER